MCKSRLEIGIKDLKLIEPIQIVATSTSTKKYFFNKKFYGDKSEIWPDVSDFIKNNPSKKNIASIFNENIKITNFFNSENNSWTTLEELDEIVDQIINEILNLEVINSNDTNNKLNEVTIEAFKTDTPYMSELYTTSKGIVSQEEDAITDLINQTLKNLKPIFIFQKPKLVNDQFEIVPYQLPYPLYSISEGIINENEQNKNLAVPYQYIYNPNLIENVQNQASNNSSNNTNLANSSENNNQEQPSSNATLKETMKNVKILKTDSEIINYFLKKIAFTFNVHSKMVSKLEVLRKNKYSEVRTDIFSKKVFLAKTSLGERKFFLSQVGALKWLAAKFELKTMIPNYIKERFSWKNTNSNQDDLENNQEDIHFYSITELIDWILENKVEREFL